MSRTKLCLLFFLVIFLTTSWAKAQDIPPIPPGIKLTPEQQQLLQKELQKRKKQKVAEEQQKEEVAKVKEPQEIIDSYLTPIRLEIIKQKLIETQGEITLSLIKDLEKDENFQAFDEEELLKIVLRAKEKLLPELQTDLGTYLSIKTVVPNSLQIQVISQELSKTNGQINLILIENLLQSPVFSGLSTEEVIRLAFKAQELLKKKAPATIFSRYLEGKSPQAPLKVSTQLKPFGYEIFKRAELPTPYKPVSPDYIIGPGDEIHILLWGRINDEYTLQVNRDGTIFLPQIGQFLVSGMTYAQMQKFLIKQVKRITGTNAAVTLGKLRGIQVFVLGEVNNPGVYNLTPMCTILDALLLAGGPTSIGSLRNIQLKRKGKIISHLDVYDLLLKGDNSKDLRLRQDDIVFVPTVGPLVAISGEVKRPAVYELKKDTSLSRLIALAGGLLPSAHLQHIQVERFLNHKKQVVLDVAANEKAKLDDFRLEDGDFVKVFSVVKQSENVVYLIGNIRYPGEYQYRPGMRISDLIKGPKDLLPDTFLDFAVIKRYDPATSQWAYKTFNLQEALTNTHAAENIALKPRDTIIIYNKWEVMPKKTVTVSGAVNKPGSYEFLPHMKVSDLIALAGGLKYYAYKQEAEIVRRVPSPKGMKTQVIRINLAKALAGDPKHNLELQEDDNLLIRSVPEWEKAATVEITGEVRFPGKYVIRKGERLSSVLARAGGYTERAYLRGAIFTRKKLQELQQKQLEEMIDRLEKELLAGGAAETSAALTPQEAAIKAEEMKAKKEFLARLKTIKAKGRLVIHLKPLNELKGSPDDIELEDGDKLYIPANPHTIQVVGAVYNQTAFVYKPGKDVSYYLNLAGGYTKSADKKELYILKVDGTAIRPRGYALSFKWNSHQHRWESAYSMTLEPGDTIVVPEKLEKIAWMRNVKDITQILYQIAVTAGVIIAAY